MPLLVCTTATLTCSMGTTPSTFTGACARVNVQGKPAATVMDHKPMANVAPFGLCRSLANPVVAAATSAAMGTLTPQPCMPATMTPWSPGSAKVKLTEKPALRDNDRLVCNWAGQIQVSNAGQAKVSVS